ncbi:thiol-disulfide oxidoreductase DCC family protein [Knoellia subterranea]|uniref:Thiol-disulfide oxidoreductase n=1 Tax=Knoellia subterranea KCTC 19937 TaxID=1385521 RepID=A0A0A0JJ73_9MICO|nr:thiol-disulfide oxidoreductase [Knoellia subterranea KCTC 19937]
MSHWGVLVYDGDCGFCERSIARIRALSGTRARAVASHSIDLADYGLTADECAEAVQWVTPTARTSGAEALRDFAGANSRAVRVVGHAAVNSWSRPLTTRVYAVIARHRHRLGSPSCGLPRPASNGSGPAGPE